MKPSAPKTGAAADKLKQVLSAAEVADLADGGEVDIETLLAAQMGACDVDPKN
jgi:type I restriction enzyme R subunit